ncbi:uncharacterized protein C8A04DRAFT_16026 [Dichotomopilus funicola]|uniref:Uncharacterized protein n=1 Tax=Dichotomopilus funicola TaxID=1934379 RepID=A0AAN6UU56_9PEZI|nr:hypothetical protein C8A04DRAFT_16026 [Dichotomopilus funicola]
MQEQRCRANIAGLYDYLPLTAFWDTTPPTAKEASLADSTYESAFDVTSPRRSSIDTPDLNTLTTPCLPEDTLRKFCDTPFPRTQLKRYEVPISSDACPVDAEECDKESLGTDDEECEEDTLTTDEEECDEEECDEESLAADDEDMDADGHSIAPTPWPESWYEGGSELGLQQFAARVIENCLGHHGDAEAINDEFSTVQCPTDNDAGRNGHEHTDATTTGASSATGQTTHSGRPFSGGHPAKRPRSSDDGDSEEDRPPKRRDAKGPPDNDANPRKLYACPYQKRMPQQSPFCGMPHGSKRDFGWDSVSRVKYHLFESHGLDHHCRNCWRAYKTTQTARRCHEMKKCSQRTSPPKHWLSESQIAQLKAERVDSQSDEAWYRIADLLFGSDQDYSPVNFRAEHTPYYDTANYRKPVSDEPSPYRSPGSMWTPASDSTNLPGSTAMPGNQNVALPVEPVEGGQSAPALASPPHQQGREFYVQAGPEAATIADQEARQPAMELEPSECDNPDVAIYSHIMVSAQGCPAPETTGHFPSEQQLHSQTVQDLYHLLDEDEMAQFFDFGPTATDPSQPHLADLHRATPASTTCEPLLQFTNTAAVEQLSLACSCGHAQKCICRLKKRVADLRSENKSLLAEKETMRNALVGLRQTLDRQDELLQFMEEKGLLPGETMGKLWEYQDMMKAVVLEHR